MAREKNISIQHYVNTRLSGLENEDGTRSYPLYTQVVYGRESTKFKATTDGKFPHVTTLIVWEKHVDEIKEGIFPDESMKRGVLAKDKKIRKIVEHEIEKQGDKFKLKGLGKRVKVYDTHVKDIIIDRIYFEFTEFLGANVTHKEYLAILGSHNKVENQLAKLMELKPTLIAKAPTNFKAWTGIIFLFHTYAKQSKEITCYDWLILPNTKSDFIDYSYKFLNSKEFKKNYDFYFDRKEIEALTKTIDIYIEVYLKHLKWISPI